MTIPVAIFGAKGRMGAKAEAAIAEAEGLEVVAALGRGDAPERAAQAGAQVGVVLTTPEAAPAIVDVLVDNGIHAVIGTTGWSEAGLDALRARLGEHPGVGVLIAPNFSIGAVLAMRFAELAAPYFESAEVVEIHHPNKLDAPSGTARHTAEKIAAARSRAGLGPVPDATTLDEGGARGAVVDGIHVHAVRQRGMVAHEEILFGGPAEALTIRTDSFDQSSFMPGIVRSVRAIADHPGLTIGLEEILGL